MKNRIAFTLVMLVVLAAFHSGINAQEKKRPNILFVIVDDQSPYDLKIYDPNSKLDTPNIDRLAREGMVFDGAYHMGSWVGAVCTASRHMIMSGRSVWHIPEKVRRGKKFKNQPKNLRQPNANNPNLVPPNLAQNTMPAVFNRAGYATMRTCKNGNSYELANKLFTVRHDATKRGSTDETGSAWHAEQVLNYLNDRDESHETKPFLIYFGFSHPHDVRDGKPELLAKYGAVNHRDKNSIPPANENQPPLPINYLEKHPFHHGHPKLRDEVAVSGVWERRDERTIRNELGREFACSENIDSQLGRVIQKTERDGRIREHIYHLHRRSWDGDWATRFAGKAESLRTYLASSFRCSWTWDQSWNANRRKCLSDGCIVHNVRHGKHRCTKNERR